MPIRVLVGAVLAGLKFLSWLQVMDVVSPRTIHFDVSRVSSGGRPGGIARTAIQIVHALLTMEQTEFEFSFLAVDSMGRIRSRNQWASAIFGTKLEEQFASPYRLAPGDILLGLDLSLPLSHWRRNRLRRLRSSGVAVFFMVYDLLPVDFPEFFKVGKRFLFLWWLSNVANADGLIAISHQTKDRLLDYLSTRSGHPVPSVAVVPLGTFFDACNEPFRKSLPRKSGVLMVGTLEPRKGYWAALDTFEELWTQGLDLSLSIVGRPGWRCRRLIARIENLEGRGYPLKWLSMADDETLLNCYRGHDVLLVNSAAEGFGLPVLEALGQDLQVLCPRIAPFTEFGDSRIRYFTPGSRELFSLLREVKASPRPVRTPLAQIVDFQWFSWSTTADRILSVIATLDGERQ